MRLNLPAWLSRWLPLICLALPLAVAVILLLAGRLDLLYAGLPIMASVLLAGLVGLASPGLFGTPLERDECAETSGGVFLNLSLLFLLLFTLSLYLLFRFEARPLTYFVLVAMMAAVILVETQTAGIKTRGGLVVLQITVLSLSLAWGPTLRLPFYIGDGDIASHLYLAGTIAGSGHITSALGDYQFFPLFHVLNARPSSWAAAPSRRPTSSLTACFLPRRFPWLICWPGASPEIRGWLSAPGWFTACRGSSSTMRCTP